MLLISASLPGSVSTCVSAAISLWTRLTPDSTSTRASGLSSLPSVAFAVSSGLAFATSVFRSFAVAVTAGSWTAATSASRLARSPLVFAAAVGPPSGAGVAGPDAGACGAGFCAACAAGAACATGSLCVGGAAAVC